MFILADTVLLTVRNFRFIWIGGRFGGGKSSLAVAISHYLLETGEARRCISNIPLAFAERDLNIAPPAEIIRDCVILIDEGGQFLETTTSFRNIVAFLRKFNCYLIIPSVIPPALQFRQVTIERWLSLKYLTGISLWVYRMRVRGDKPTTFLFRPEKRLFDWYDTTAKPADDGGIGTLVTDAYESTKVSYVSYTKQRKQQPQPPHAQLQLPGLDELSATAESMERLANVLETARIVKR